MRRIVNNLQKRINNVGSALIMVIVCMLLIGIITSVVIVTASSNLGNVMLYKKNSENFYTAEYVLDEFKKKLEDYADAAVRNAYQSWLTEYSYYNTGEQHEKFKKLFIKDYKEILIRELNIVDNTIPGGEASPPSTVTSLAAIIADTRFGEDKVRFLETPVFKPSDDTEIILNVKIAYYEDDGTESIIDTDLKFSINPEDFKINTAAGVNTAAAEYAVITDGLLTNETGKGQVDITGSIYAGTGLDFVNNDGSGIFLDSDKIVTRDTFKVSNGAKVEIRGTNAIFDADSYGNVWAKNVLLEKNPSGRKPEILAKANFFLADDLTINAPKAKFELTGPACAFYGYGADEEDVSKSSAIVVNAKDAKIYLDGLDPEKGGKIAIAGKSFISIPENFGVSTVQASSLQGESISLKGEQAAYLLPSECVVGIGHNPMTESEYYQLRKGTDSFYTNIDHYASPSAITNYLNIGKSALNGGVDLESYVKLDKPVKSFFVKYDNGVNMVYLYLNFRDSKSATAYFEKYNEIYPKTVESRTKNLGGEIRINPLTLDTVGNVTIPKAASGSATFIPSTRISSNQEMVLDQWNFTMKYSGLVNNLTEKYLGLGTQEYLTDNVVNFREVPSDDFSIDSGTPDDLYGKKIVAKDSEGHSIERFTFSADGAPRTRDYYLYAGHDITVEKQAYGIIVASGNVTIKNGAQFVGLIVARGNVYCEGENCMVKRDYDNIVYILKNCSDVKKIFEITSVTTGTGSGGSIISSDIIKIEFENWKKN